MSEPLEFRILGPLELSVGKPRALLAVLLLSQGEVVSVDRIGG